MSATRSTVRDMHPGGDHLRSEAVVARVHRDGGWPRTCRAGRPGCGAACRSGWHGPAVALVPGTGSSKYRERVRAAVRPGEPVPAGVAVVASTSGIHGRCGWCSAAGDRSALGRGRIRRAHRPARASMGGRVATAFCRWADGGRAFGAERHPTARTPDPGWGRAVHGAASSRPRSPHGGRADGMPLAVWWCRPCLPSWLGREWPRFGRCGTTTWSSAAGQRPPSTLDARLTAEGVRLMRSYGMTETCGGAVFDGIPLTGVRVSVHPGGRLRVTGAQVAAGYRDDRQAERWGVDAAGERWFADRRRRRRLGQRLGHRAGPQRRRQSK